MSSSVVVHTSLNLGNAEILPDTNAFTSDISETHIHRDILRIRSNPTPKNPSLVIPSVHNSITRNDIFNVFRHLNIGHIDNIQIINDRRKTSPFVPVYIHFIYWYDNEDATRIKDHILDKKEFKVKYDDAHPNRFWKVLLSDLPKPMPSISHEPTIVWHTRIEEDGDDLIEVFGEDATAEESVEGKQVSLVIPRVRKGYTAEHIKWSFRQLCISKDEQHDDCEDGIQVDLVMPRRSAKGSAVAYMTAYVHVTMNRLKGAAYFYNYINDGHSLEIENDVRPRSWTWLVKKSDLSKPDRKTRTERTDGNSNGNNTTVISSTPRVEL